MDYHLIVQAIFFCCFFPGAGGVLFTNIVCLYDNWCYNIYAIYRCYIVISVSRHCLVYG